MPAATATTASSSSNETAAAAGRMAMTVASEAPSSSSTSTTSGNNNSNNNTDSLARSNLLRLETCELLKESVLHIHPATSSSTTTTSGDHYHHHGGGGSNSGVHRAHEEAKWAPSVREYLDKVARAIAILEPTKLSPSVAILPNSGADDDKPMYRIPLLSDKFHKSLPPSTSTTTGGVAGGKQQQSSADNPLTSWSFPFHGGSSLSLVPIGSFGHIGNAGLANRHANGGNVLPVLDVAVLVDNNITNHGNSSLFVGGKDYLNHRYTDVSFVFLE
jgi:hypothetical protein